MSKTGHADLPLHYGRVPPWLADRMKRLSGAIIESIVLDYGRGEVLKRLSDPLWFQSFGAVMGMDWHSSGITTSVMGALKRSMYNRSKELGIYICGGRGRHSRKTPEELLAIGYATGMDGEALARCSRLSAKVDNTSIQDGFQIYLHNFIVTEDGDWAVVQQGMNKANGMARRYHWHSKELKSFVSEPHASVCGTNQGLILNLVHEDAGITRDGIVQFATEHPDRNMQEIKKIVMPNHHDVQIKDVDLKRLGAVLAVAYEHEVPDFESLLLTRGLGPRTLQSLTLVSEVIHGTPSRFEDPARFSFAHGGKDGYPFPVPTKVYDETIEMLDRSVARAKIGLSDKKDALKRLHELSKKIETGFTPDPSKFQKWIEKEKADSSKFGGRTIEAKKSKGKADRQLKLF